MGTIDWYIEGIEFGNCNCVYACPYQFEALPTDGHCRGFEVLRIDKGHFGEVVLDGLNIAMLYAWPAYSAEAGQPVHAKVATQSTRSRPPVPRQAGHPSERSDAGVGIVT